MSEVLLKRLRASRSCACSLEESGDTIPCRMTGVTLQSKVTPVILHGVVSPEEDQLGGRREASWAV